MISVVSPPSNETGQKDLFFSINNINYYPIYYLNRENVIRKITFNYYEEIKILSINPIGFYNSEMDILVSASNVIENDYLRCKIYDLVTYVTKTIIDNNLYYKCEVEHVIDVLDEIKQIFSNITNRNIFKSCFFS